MNFLLPTALALAIGVAAELGYESGLRAPWIVLLLLPLPHLLSRAALMTARAGRWPRARRFDRAARALPILGHAAALCLFGWSTFLREQFGNAVSLLDWPGPGLALIVAPFLILEVLSIDARVRFSGLSKLDGHRLRAFQLRMFTAALAPIAIYVILTLPLRHMEGVRVRVEEVGLIGAVWSGALLVIFAVTLPALLAFAWDTVSLPSGPERKQLTDLAERAGFRYRDLRLWRTGGLVANAAIVGFSAKQRVVLLSDSLLAQLSRRELAAVFCHEMGHSLRRHALIFAAWTLGMFLTADGVLSMLDRFVGDDSALLTEGFEFAFIAALALAWYIGFGWLSRRFELDADLTSLELTRDPEALAAALEAVGGGSARHQASWRHFSTAKRVLFLRAAARDSSTAQRLRRSLDRFSALGFGLLGLGLMLEFLVLTARLDDDQLAVDLRLGHYREAAERVQASDAPDAQLARLAALASELSATEQEFTPARCVQLALGEFQAGNAERARELLELATLRDFEPARAPLRAMYDLEDGQIGAALAAFERVGPDWGAAAAAATL